MIGALRALALAALVLSSPTAEAAAKKPLEAGEKVDLNAAPLEELMRLPGIGRKRAEAIVALRGRRPFRRPEDLASVKGISPAWVAKNRASLSTGPPPPATKP